MYRVTRLRRVLKCLGASKRYARAENTTVRGNDCNLRVAQRSVATAPRTVASATSAQTKESTGESLGLAAATELPTYAPTGATVTATSEQPNDIYFGELRSERAAGSIRSVSASVGAQKSAVESDRLDSLLSLILGSSRDQEGRLWNPTASEFADGRDAIDAANEALEEAFATLTLL